MHEYGYNIVKVLISDIVPDPKVKAAMNDINAAQREQVAATARGEADKILVVDVRSHGYYDPDAARIKGSIRIEPNNLEQELQRIPPDKDIYLYCT